MFYNFAVGEEDEVVTGGLGEANFVGDEDEFDAFVLGEGADFLEDVDGDFWVEGGGGFVEEEKFGVDGDGSADSDALALSAGKFGWAFVGVIGEPEEFEGFLDAGF